MQAEWAFWTAATALALGVLALVLAPLYRGVVRPERRASYDLQVYRDQLREVEADLARGVVTAAEAEAVRVEISRRLLAAADAEAAEAASSGAPRPLSLAAAAALSLVLALAAGLLYASLGSPGRPDLPLEPRRAELAAARVDRPSQAEVEAIVAARPPQAAAAEPSGEDLALLDRLRRALEARPEDAEGHRLLARSEASVRRWPEAREAQQRVIALLGPGAAAQDHLDLAEFMIIGANGYVSPEAEAALGRALERAPEDPVARYYSGLALLQGGRADLAFDLWSRLLAEGPPDAPWIAPIATQIDEVALLAGRAAPGVAPGAAPEATPEADAGATGAAPPSEADRAAMIAGMVAQLSDRLAAEGGPPEDWARLIRSLGVLGRVDEASAILREARDVFAADPAALGLLRGTAREAGIGQ